MWKGRKWRQNNREGADNTYSAGLRGTKTKEQNAKTQSNKDTSWGPGCTKRKIPKQSNDGTGKETMTKKKGRKKHGLANGLNVAGKETRTDRELTQAGNERTNALRILSSRGKG